MSENDEQTGKYRRRIKTEATSMVTTPTVSPTSDKNRFFRDEGRFPSLYKKQRRFQSNNLNMINEEENSDNAYWNEMRQRRNTVSMSHNAKKQMFKAEKIFEALCKTESTPQSIIIHTSNIRLQNSHPEIYEKPRLAYQQMKSNKKTKDIQQLFNLITILKTINNLFSKLDDILCLILLKKGKIYEFQENCTVYTQNQPQNGMLIVLWGEVKLKEIYRNKVKFCIPGDMLCEEVLIQPKKGGKKYFSDIGFSKGSLIAGETAKTTTKCAVLEITKESFEEIRARFNENGQKDKILIFEHMLAWSLSKKAKLRR